MGDGIHRVTNIYSHWDHYSHLTIHLPGDSTSIEPFASGSDNIVSLESGLHDA
jgi:hypothetical protein